jgi:hypothetical protein
MSCYGNGRKDSLIDSLWCFLLIRYGVEMTRLVLAPRVTTSNYAERLSGKRDDACALFVWLAVRLTRGSEENDGESKGEVHGMLWF